MKLLLISHNAIGSDTNMGMTSQRLLSEFSNDELCQIFVKGTISNDNPIESIFLSEINMMKSIIFRKNFWTTDLLPGEKGIEQPDISVTKRSVIKLIVRHYLWKISKWRTNFLDDWIRSLNPTCIFVMPGDSSFIYFIAEYISLRFSVPLVTYFGDDYSDSFNSNKSFISNHYHNLLSRHIKNIVTNSSSLVYISDSLNDKYNTMFHKKGTTLMTPYSFSLAPKKEVSEIPTLKYIGNLDSGRFDTIVSISKVITELNKEKMSVDLQIFAPNMTEDKINCLNKEHSYYKGVLSQEEVILETENADFLLHIESFDKDIFKTIEHSFSTKLASYLASGRLIVAHGPNNVNSMKYLENNRSALVSHDLEVFSRNLKKLVSDSSFKDEIIENAAFISNVNHDPKKNPSKLKEIIKEIK